MKYIHILFVILFTGLFISNYYYTTTGIKSVKKSNLSLLVYSLRCSFYVDIILGVGIVVIPVTCVMLIIFMGFSFFLSWLVSAYWLCGIASLAWMGILTIKLKNYRQLKIDVNDFSKGIDYQGFRYKPYFHFLSVLVMLCLLVTLHDAVFQQTLFGAGQAITASYSAYQWLKIFHVISASVLFGTGAGTALYMLLANFSGNASVIARATERVVIADWLFTLSSGVIQAITGLSMVYLEGYGITEFWVLGSIIGYVVAGCCWFPVVYLQMKCRDIAFQAENSKQALPLKYYRLFYTWCFLGIPAFLSLLFVIYLMTEKPVW